MEIRIESVNKDNSHSWVRISHGLNKLVTDLIDEKYDDNQQETSETKTETFALKTDVFAFCKQIKGKSKAQKTYLCLLIYKHCTFFFERTWIDMKPGTQIDQAYPVAKKTKYPSSTRRMTSRRRRCDRILETER